MVLKEQKYAAKEQVKQEVALDYNDHFDFISKSCSQKKYYGNCGIITMKRYHCKDVISELFFRALGPRLYFGSRISLGKLKQYFIKNFLNTIGFVERNE